MEIHSLHEKKIVYGSFLVGCKCFFLQVLPVLISVPKTLLLIPHLVVLYLWVPATLLRKYSQGTSQLNSGSIR